MDKIEKIRQEIKELVELLEDHNYYLDNSEQALGYSAALDDIEKFLDSLESEKPMNPDDAMKELDEKIALVKQRGTWDGVDVDKYMDEVRGREPEKPVPADLEEAARLYAIPHYMKDVDVRYLEEYPYDKIAESAFIAGAKWQKLKDEERK